MEAIKLVCWITMKNNIYNNLFNSLLKISLYN